ncbi:kynurenine 3-monooxygenase-like isoform X2 [Asterias amurensis]|uniref:kynurenine 3-monooxygenase-like isoform X2 n=1 Tax=Asterias amurensis TaxID=7602 RepID=UPI003AB42639
MGSTDMNSSSALNVAVVGGGLVGSLEAILLAKRGFNVELYEAREDIRTLEHVSGRSINLALSVRGRAALQLVGLEEQFILSVDRRLLNETLLTEAEKYPNIQLHFSHKLLQANLDKGTLVFKKEDGSEMTVQPDLIIGCDGAYSAIRKQMIRLGRMSYSQEYIPHGYMELCIPPKEGKFATRINYLHIWPRDEFMMIALPNMDASFTCTLFMPFAQFDQIENEGETAGLDFFRKYFPDAIPLIGEKEIKETFLKNRGLPMVSIKCSHYNYKDRVLIMGDAAHAMVPFYGQGMNCGFEDCVVLEELLEKYNNDFAKVLPAFSEHRAPDAQAMCDLAMYNYVEMRSLVNSRWFLLKKKVDKFLNWLMPKKYIPLYTMVTFSRIRYHSVIQQWKRQDKFVEKALFYLMCVPAASIGVFMLSYFKPSTFSWLRK